MTNTEAAKVIGKLAEKAMHAEKSEDAMRFSQAATNIANAVHTLRHIPNGATSPRA